MHSDFSLKTAVLPLAFTSSFAIKTPNQTFEGYMYKVHRRKRGLAFVRAPKTCSWAPQLPPNFLSPFTLPPKNEKPLTAEKLPPYGITAIFWFYRLRPSRYRQKNEKPPTPKNYRYVLVLPPRLCSPKKTLPTITLEFSDPIGMYVCMYGHHI